VPRLRRPQSLHARDTITPSQPPLEEHRRAPRDTPSSWPLPRLGPQLAALGPASPLLQSSFSSLEGRKGRPWLLASARQKHHTLADPRGVLSDEGVLVSVKEENTCQRTSRWSVLLSRLSMLDSTVYYIRFEVSFDLIRRYCLIKSIRAIELFVLQTAPSFRLIFLKDSRNVARARIKKIRERK